MLNLKLISIFFLLLCDTLPIKLRYGRYEDVYIVIQDSVQENSELLERIKDVFTKASELLFSATKYQAYFGKIKVIIPKSWSTLALYRQLPALSALRTYITIDEGLIKIPHVRSRTHACGEEGWYMHLTPAFLLETGVTDCGTHENVIVHEWGHLRWGLFDENSYSPERKKQFYQHDGEWKPVRCLNQLQGTVGRGSTCSTRLSGTYCNTKNTGQMMHSTCTFCPYQEQSLMGFKNIRKITTFCDKDDDSVSEDQRHNSIAPNAQNLFCNSRSVWEVMREHGDFKNNTFTMSSTRNTTPEFEFIQEREGFRVFVLDISGSMNDNGRIDTLRQTGEYIIQETIPAGSWLGIVTFHALATRVKGLTQVNSQTDRDALKAAFPRRAAGGTCIGCGIEEAISMLNEQLGSAENGEIIVISDGVNSNGDLDRSRGIAIDAKVVIYTIAVSQIADTTLPDIAHETGGKHFTYLETGSISFAAVFKETIAEGLTSAASRIATLVSEKVDSASATDLSVRFAIENRLGQNTSIIVLTNITDNIQLELYGPNNYTDFMTVNGNSAQMRITDIAQVGDYELRITTSGLWQSLEYYVTSAPTATNNGVIRVFSRLSSSKIDFSTDDLPVVFADVLKNYAPVLNVTVNAVVYTNDTNKNCTLTLFDNGMDPDNLKNDGTYSGYIWSCCLSSGRINVKVYARGIRGETMFLNNKTGCYSQTTDEDKTEMIVDSFQRVVVTEELYVVNYNYTTSDNKDVVAPGRITDVAINNVITVTRQKRETRNVTLIWTATGDDKNSGQATTYEMKYSNSHITLRDSFEMAEFIDTKNLTFIPKLVGETEALKIVIEADELFTETMYFAVRALDETGNVGPISNIVPIVTAPGFHVFGEQGYLVNSTDEDISVGKSSETKDGTDKTSTIICVSIITTVLLTVVATSICLKKLVLQKKVAQDIILRLRVEKMSRTARNVTNNLYRASEISQRRDAESTTIVEPFHAYPHGHISSTSKLPSPGVLHILPPGTFESFRIAKTTKSFDSSNVVPGASHLNDGVANCEQTFIDASAVDIVSGQCGDRDNYKTGKMHNRLSMSTLPFHLTNKVKPVKITSLYQDENKAIKIFPELPFRKKEII